MKLKMNVKMKLKKECRKEYYECVCGSKILSISTHFKTKKHKNFIIDMVDIVS